MCPSYLNALFKITDWRFGKFLKMEFKKIFNIVVTHILVNILFSAFFPEQTNSPKLCSVPGHPPFYLIILEDEKLFHSTPTKPVIPSTIQSQDIQHDTMPVIVTLLLSFLSLHSSGLQFVCVTSSECRFSTDIPGNTHVFLYLSKTVWEYWYTAMEDRRLRLNSTWTGSVMIMIGGTILANKCPLFQSQSH